ncbi:MAG: hypothetical protein JWM74_1455, partial [Myxococcaceae bacterium]|nr:hypothetical protein [Myxococcaceae bacterium]
KTHSPEGRAARATDDALRAVLDAVRDGTDRAARRDRDPVGFVHRYTTLEDREIVALVAASIAFGNVTTIRGKLEDLLGRVGRVAPSPAVAAEDPAALTAALATWKHRVFLGDDLARLMIGARRVQLTHGSLGARFREDLAREGTLKDALATWCDAIRDAGDVRSTTRRGPAHLLPDPRGASGCKRLVLFLRWMVRPDDGVDLGLWDVDPSVLLMPVDTHIHKLARNLGLTKRKDVSWKTTVEITRALARLDPSDPVKYDFSLCHLGMLQRCPSKKDAARCEGCGVKPVCRHWTFQVS